MKTSKLKTKPINTMSSWIKNITQLSDDVLGLVEDKVKHSRQKQYWKNAMDEIIKDISPQLFVKWITDDTGVPFPVSLDGYSCCYEEVEYETDSDDY